MEDLRSEDTIIDEWGQDASNPLVSICCTAYNHELYIEDTIKGFLIQKTNFPFEILIHDDSSTDNTPKIIRKLELQYPNIIKPIYQQENQYSKGIKVNFTYNYSRAKGKYISLCEGDDYWSDERKLQKQFDILERNSKIALCVHATSIFNVSDNLLESNKIRLNEGDKFLNAKDVILGGGDFGHTSSFFFRKEIIINPPRWFMEYPSGDTPLRLLSAYLGLVYYLDQDMSVYRRGVKGSWTTRVKNNKNYILHWSKGIKMLNEYNKYTNYQYAKEIEKRISQIAYQIMIRLETLDSYKCKKDEYYSVLTLMDKVKYSIRVKYPQLFNMLKSFKRG